MKRDVQVIYEDDYMLAINKPPRVASVPGENIPLNRTVLGYAVRQFEEKGIKPYLLHRLDYQTSGVLLFGKFPRDREALEGIFRHPATHKKYIALVKGIPHGKSITKMLQARASSQKIPAQTDYKIIKVFKGPGFLFSLIEAKIKTGRKHQIRQHFAAISHPIVLDSKYGDQRFNRKFRLAFRLGRQFLHAESISFFHPILKKNMQINAPLPPDLKSVLKKLSPHTPLFPCSRAQNRPLQ